MHAMVRRFRTASAVAAVALVLLGGCAQVVPGRATADHPGAPAARLVAVTEADAVSAAGTEALQRFWRTAFPAAFGRAWRDVAVFAPVRPSDPGAPVPPCVDRAAEVDGQAFYCPAADAVVWDAAGLMPELRERFGPAGVTVVLAHEVGHAVQSRLGLDRAQRREPARYPTILLEAMSDCYAGVALAHLARRPVPDLPPAAVERDAVLHALLGFGDPLGVDAGEQRAHGNGFDRVSAFQDGYEGDARACAGLRSGDRTFTQRRFGSPGDRARGGNLAPAQLLTALEPDLRRWFTAVGAAHDPAWTAPALRPVTDRSCGGADTSTQGPVRFCPSEGSVLVDRAALTRSHRHFGDFAAAVLVASRYGLAALAATGQPARGPAAGAAALCLAGAYAGGLVEAEAGFALSPGDLDEAVRVLLADDRAARDADGEAEQAERGYERVAHFRTGVLRGADGCLPRRR